MARAAVLFLIALGGLLVARAASIYGGTDPLALSIVALIGLGLLVGGVEQWRRATLARRWLHEVAALPQPCTAEAIESTSGGLRSWLRAYAQGGARGASIPGFTPYLLGLLVMLGMLGTFMGMVQTLAGARDLMDAGTDIDTLRRSLSAPIGGLTRAFGTSVAGVSASAALGMAALFARRAEGKAWVSLHGYALMNMAHLTPAARQHEVLDALARSGEALPGAAEALKEAAASIASLKSGLVEGQAEAAVAVSAAVAARMGEAVEALAAVGEDVRVAAVESQVEASARGEAALVAAGEAAAAAAGEAAAAALGAWTEAVDTASAQRRVEERAHLVEVERRLSEAGARVEASARRQAEGTSEAFVALSERLRVQAEASAEVADRRGDRLRADASAALDLQAEAVVKQAEAEHARRADAQALSAVLVRQAEGRAEHELARMEALDLRLAALAEAEQARSEAFAEALARQAEVRAVHDEARTEALDVRLMALADAEAARAEALHQRLARATTEAVAARTQATADELRRLATFADEVSALRGDLATTVQQGADAATEVAALVTRYQGDLEQVEARVEARMQATVTTLSEALARQVERLQASQRAGAVETARTLVQVDAAFATHLGALATELAGPLTAAAAASAGLVEGVEARLAAREVGLGELTVQLGTLTTQVAASAALGAKAGAARLEALMALAEGAIGQQAEALAGLTMRLERSQRVDAEARDARLDEHIGRLTEALITHAAEASAGVEGAAGTVQRAADLLQAGGAELGAVAEMFTAAVDDYRAISERWLSQLDGLEDALDRTGEGDGTAQLFGEYLDQMREVFGDTLRFQRALFQELRALREERA